MVDLKMKEESMVAKHLKQFPTPSTYT